MELTPSSSSYEDSTKLADDSSGSVSVSDAATSTIVVPINSKVGLLLSLVLEQKKYQLPKQVGSQLALYLSDST